MDTQKRKSMPKLLAEAFIGGFYTAMVFAGPYTLIGYALSIQTVYSMLFTFLTAMLSFLTGVFLQRRVLQVVTGCCLHMVLLCGIWLFTDSWVYSLCFLPLALRGMFVSGRFEQAVGAVHALAGGIGLLICFFITRLNDWDTLYPVFEWTGALMLVCTLLLANRKALSAASPVAGLVGRSMKRSNMFISLALIAVIFITANIQSIHEWITFVWEQLKHGLAQLALFLAGLLPGADEVGGGEAPAQMDMSDMFPAVESRPDNPIFTAIINIVAIIVVVAGAVALIFVVGRLLYRAYLRFKKLMSDMMAEGNYTEEAVSLFDWDEVLSNISNSAEKVRRALIRPKPWRSLTDAERVRRAYAIYIKKSEHPDEFASKTVREAVTASNTVADAQVFAASYDRVRYGDMDATPQEAENAKKLAGL